MSSKDIKYTFNFLVPKHLATTVKINGTISYGLSLFVSLLARKRTKASYRGSSSNSFTAYDNWMASDYSVMVWLLSSMNKNVSVSVMFLKTVAKEIYDTLKEMYFNEQNISRVADLYEKIFSL